MGSFLSMPLVIISSLLGKDILHYLYYGFIYGYLKLCDVLWKKRLDLYDFHAVGQPEKFGFLIPEKEKELDMPKKENFFQKFSDDAFCFGTNSKSEYLAIYISRQAKDFVQCSVVLRLADGKEYQLPEEHLLQNSTSEDNTFGSPRIKMQCLAPMRKWRIFFNGILEENSSENKESNDRYKHVKFTLLWAASSDVFDFSCDMSKRILSYTEVSEKSGFTMPTSCIRKLKRLFDSYDQPGMIFGTLQFEGEEEREIYLWGVRGRFMGEKAYLENAKISEIFANFENGSALRLGILNSPGICKRFPYGYIMRSDGFIMPVEELESNMESSTDTEIMVACVSDKKQSIIKIICFNEHCLSFLKELDAPCTLKFANVEMNGLKGNGFLFHGLNEGMELKYRNLNLKASINFRSLLSFPLTISLDNESCQDPLLCGGKGSSLAKLFALSKSLTQNHSEFTVPSGIVVTTEAYLQFTKGPLSILLEKFQKEIWCHPNINEETLCQKIVENVACTKLPNIVMQSIEEDLKQIFGKSVDIKKVAVRSSAIGEDTEQMSCAGQMTTYLGVVGINEIFQAVTKCWASQFSFQAIEYKRRYGQILNMPMAVVIMEMVPCEAAGVMLSCDPLTGNPLKISITANWGLGESVVSGSAEPDTINLKRTIDNEISIHSQELGSKAKYIVMNENSGTKIEEDIQKSSVCCISEETALKLGCLAIEIEENFGSPQDVEWGIFNGQVFLLQSRPVTSIDVDTDFETKHCFDTYQRIENEFFTKANVGEVLPGATTPLGISIMDKSTFVMYPRQFVRWDGADLIEKPFFIKGARLAWNHYFFCMTDGFFKYNIPDEDYTNAFVVSMFGRLIDDTEIRRLSKERHSVHKKSSVWGFGTIAYIYFLMFFAGAYTRFREKKMLKKTIKYREFRSANELLQKIGSEFDIIAEPFCHHMNCTFISSMWNLPILKLLAKSNGAWNNTVYADFACLLSTCKDVVSADVPAKIEDLSASIAKDIDPTVFKNMTAEEAIRFLETSSSEAGIKYKKFMKKHGHRCKKEFDITSETWEINPRPLIITLQGLLNKRGEGKAKRKEESLWTIISNLQIKFSFTEKLKLLWLVYNAQRGVRDREYSKSLTIRSINRLRLPIHHMAELMVEEGRLPRKELMFFLSVEELIELLKTRSPRLISRAHKRSRFHNQLDKLIFSEIMSGIPKPINYTEHINTSVKGLTMTGVPVSQGIVKAVARVIMSLDEVSDIMPGDILITYSTDISWSPYFPLLSGVVTEIGGLISHGAVVAREYGLPCVVGLHGATKAFKSGELVILNGNKGTLQRVETE